MKLVRGIFLCINIFSVCSILPYYPWYRIPYRLQTKTKLRAMEYDIIWDSGEVNWGFDNYYFSDNDNENSNLDNINTNNTIFVYPITQTVKNQINQITPLYNTIEQDQNKMATLSAIVKTTYKETFKINDVIFNLQNNLNFIPTEIFLLTLLSGLIISYNKTKETEIIRLKKLYKYDSRTTYFEKYSKNRRLIMILVIVITCLFTKNVQRAE